MPEPTPTPAKDPGSADDPAELARSASLEELQRLKLAEELSRLRTDRKKSGSRLVIASQVLVGYIALAGFFVNAYQSYVNKQRQDEQAQIDQAKWNKEFARASQADKYRAFFETAMLATDPTNADKRLVGYALLQEFVQDPTYERKAMVMLEESLSQELRGGPAVKLDDAHRATVVAIVTALAETDDCRALQRAARSIDRVALRYARTKDDGETRDVIDMYVRRLVGRAAQGVRNPQGLPGRAPAHPGHDAEEPRPARAQRPHQGGREHPHRGDPLPAVPGGAGLLRRERLPGGAARLPGPVRPGQGPAAGGDARPAKRSARPSPGCRRRLPWPPARRRPSLRPAEARPTGADTRRREIEAAGDAVSARVGPRRSAPAH